MLHCIIIISSGREMAASTERYSRVISSAVSSAFQHLTTSYQHLKEEQAEAVKALLAGKEVFAQLPTGFGKTTILALLPLAFDFLHSKPLGTCQVLCLTPLISLMEDQADRLQQMGLRVCMLRGGMDHQATLQSFGKEEPHIQLMSPEMALSNVQIRQQIQKNANRIVCVVVDEAHCVTTW